MNNYNKEPKGCPGAQTLDEGRNYERCRYVYFDAETNRQLTIWRLTKSRNHIEEEIHLHMLSGKSFRLKREVLAIEMSESEDRRALYVPKEAIVKVLSGPRPDDKHLVDIHWSDKKLVVFAEDLVSRGEEIRPSASVESSAV